MINQFNTEEDIKNKVINVWLAEHGISPNDISFEYSFKIKIGRRVHEIGCLDYQKESNKFIRPRSDILVKNSEGQNLLVIEVKPYAEQLTDDDKYQAISYARLLLDGNIAPFAVVTNGVTTKIYDSITTEHITSCESNLKYGKLVGRFQLDCNDIELKSKALELLISLNPQNLLLVCSSLVEFRQSLLKSSDPFSDKKYIPSLHVVRCNYENKINELLQKDDVSCIVLVGPPLIGKSNILCHLAESYIADNSPCLFYPVTRLNGGLLEGIAEDFGWVLNDFSNPTVIINKLLNVLKLSSSNLIIFLDGINEASQDLIKRIDTDCFRLASGPIKIIVSVSSVALSRTLIDQHGNLSHIAELAGLSKMHIFTLEKGYTYSQKTNFNSVITIERYSYSEICMAEQLYNEVWKIDVPAKVKQFYDPYNFATCMKLLRNLALPVEIDEIALVRGLVDTKISSTRSGKFSFRSLLNVLANLILENDGAVAQETLMQACGLSLVELPPESLFTSGLLIQVYDGSEVPKIDFYYEREKYYYIAFYTMAWMNSLENFGSISLKYGNAIEVESLKWFLSQKSILKKILFKNPIPVFSEPKLSCIFIDSLRNVKDYFPEYRCNIIEYAIKQLKSDITPDVFLSLLQLMYSLVEFIDEFIDYLDLDSLTKMIISKTGLSINYNTESSIVLELISKFNEENDNRLLELFDSVMEGSETFKVMNTAMCLAYCNEYRFLEMLCKKLSSWNRSEWKSKIYPFCLAVEFVANKVHSWHEELCFSGHFDSYIKGVDDDELANEYYSLRDLYDPIITAFYGSCNVKLFIDILEGYEEMLTDFGLPLEDVRPQIDHYSLWLPFDN